MAIQSTKPETLAYAVSDSPVGLAATFGWDRLLENVMAYWATNIAASAARVYAESRLAGTAADQLWRGHVDVSTGYSHQSYELMRTPRPWASQQTRKAGDCRDF